MSEENPHGLLAKLKVKPSPVKKKPIQIAIPIPAQKEGVRVKDKIIDQRDQNKVNREKMLNKVRKANIISFRVVPKYHDVQKEESDVDKPKYVKKGKMRLVMEGDEPSKKEIKPAKKPRERKTVSPIGVIREGPVSMLAIKDIPIEQRMPKQKGRRRYLLKTSNYYMNNRKKFINFINSRFAPYKEEILKEENTISCDRKTQKKFQLLPHQKIVQDYLNLYTPYRGLLLYHGLGSGKTCSSIAIAEGIKTDKQVMVMTPASLQMNYKEELKKCGDAIYKKNQFWEFINTSKHPELIDQLSYVLSLDVEFIKKAGGAWLVNVKKPTNYEKLTAVQKHSLDEQLNAMISDKYKFVNYNGLRREKWKAMTHNYSANPFDNKVIIIDEAHNFVSRIVNKLNKPEALSMQLYNDLMNAKNARIVMLTGTPIINYPNEIAVLFNILRGKIKTWSFKLTINNDRKISTDYFKTLLAKSRLNTWDFLEYKPTSTTLVVTKNPFGFYNNFDKKAYSGVMLGERGEMDDDTFVDKLTRLLKKENITVVKNGVTAAYYKALPDTLDGFQSLFVSNKDNDMRNTNLFKRRILGLTSYFRSAQEQLMPKYEKSTDFHVVKIPMSDFQFSIYEEARVQERKLESRNAKKQKKKGKDGLYEDSVSTYRIFSRAFCNFVFPRPDIVRPMPHEGEDIETAIKETADEDLLDAVANKEKLNNPDGRYTIEDIEKGNQIASDVSSDNYEQRIKKTLAELKKNAGKYLKPNALETYSPKFLNVLENITDPEHKGLHLIYSQFRTLEGVGIMKLILEANGFAQFKIKHTGGVWSLNISSKDKGKPLFSLYTGTESPEEKEIIRNIYNSDWKYVPNSLVSQIEQIADNNLYGEIIKVLMITSSGAEGISLRNVRYVHVIEPYWHPVRIEQVIGRARRICSHTDLPKELQTVNVFLYLMTFSQKQLDSEESIELRLKDKSKRDNKTPITSDEALFEIATIKEELNKQILTAVKETSVDCAIHSKTNEKEGLHCLAFGNVNGDKFSYKPDIDDEDKDSVAKINKQTITWQAKAIVIDGIKFALKQDTMEVYDLDSYKQGEAVLVGTLEMKGKRYKFNPIT